MYRNARLIAALAGLVGFAGCHSTSQSCYPCSERSSLFSRQQTCVQAPLPPVPNGAPILRPEGQSLPPGPAIPGVAPVPSTAPIMVPSDPQPTPGVGLQPGLPTDPARNETRLSPGVPVQPAAPQDGVQLQTPQGVTPQSPEPPRVDTNKPAQPAPLDPGVPPVDVPGFALAKTRVATGQKPFRDGIVWLQAKGYRTALYLRRPGDDDKVLHMQFEKNGLRYVSLEVSPETLTREVVEAFNRQVRDQDSLPLYVFDRDGSLTGGLWLLYFRLYEGISEEKARLEATRLGFKPELDPDHKAMLDAVARYLQAQNPNQ